MTALAVRESLSSPAAQAAQWAAERIRLRDFVVLDTETTGLDSDAEAVQIVIVNAWGRVAFSALVRPEEPIDEQGDSYGFHQVSCAMARQAPRFERIYPFVRGWLRGAGRVIAYNADFDRRIVAQCCRRACKEPPAAVWDCAMLRYGALNGEPGRYSGFKWHKLREACAHLGVREREWHDAGADALATYDLVCAMAERCSV